MAEQQEPVDERLARGDNEDEVAEANQEAIQGELPALMGPDDPRRMLLTLEEQWWAIDIKTAVEETPGLDELSDFMYAQLAIVCEDNVRDAVDRAQALQDFRQEYSILDSCEDGCHAIKKMAQLQPLFLLSSNFSPGDGAYAVAMDLTKVDTTAFSTEAQIRSYFAGCYYIGNANFPDLESMRKGLIVLVECEGFDWKKKPNFKLIQKLYSQLVSIYPLRAKLMHYHTGVIFNVMSAALKRLLPQELKDQFQIGLTFEARLDSVFLVPTAEAANQRLLHKLEMGLKRRSQNEESFSLSDDSCIAD